MSLPAWLIMMVLHLLPKPDLVVYLRNDPQVILSRKPELTLKELVRQGEVCSRLIHRLPQGRVVETTGSPDDTTAKVAKMLVDTMFPRGLTPPAEPAIPQMGAGIS
jgi:thymidylate kinase